MLPLCVSDGRSRNPLYCYYYTFGTTKPLLRTILCLAVLFLNFMRQIGHHESCIPTALSQTAPGYWMKQCTGQDQDQGWPRLLWGFKTLSAEEITFLLSFFFCDREIWVTMRASLAPHKHPPSHPPTQTNPTMHRRGPVAHAADMPKTSKANHPLCATVE